MPRDILVDLTKAKRVDTGLGTFSIALGDALLGLRPEGLVFLGPPDRWPGHALRGGLRRRFFPRTFADPDVWHATQQDPSFRPRRRNTPVVLTVHDLAFLFEKGPRKAARRLARLQGWVDRSAAVTVVSRHTEQVLRAHLRVAVPVHFIPNGVSVGETRSRPAKVPDGPFVLSMGTVLPRKNLHVIPGLLARLPDRNWVIAGDMSHAYTQEVRSAVVRAGVGERVFWLGRVSCAERDWLYSRSEVVLFPSLYEGFGLPVVEGLAHGRPVLCSDATSLPEVGGDAATYFESFAPDAMLDAYRRAIAQADPVRARARAAVFDWKTSARGYLAVYDSV